MQHLKQLTEKQEREKAKREAQAVKRRSGATSPILDIMTKELETATSTTTTTPKLSTTSTQSSSLDPKIIKDSAETKASRKVTEESITWSSGCTPSAGPSAEEADPEKAGKKLLVSTFSFI